jgi:transposase
MYLEDMGFRAIGRVLNINFVTVPRTVDSYEVFCGVLYVLKSDCPWRMLPSEFPKWRTVHEYYRQWSKKQLEQEASLLEGILKKIGRFRTYQIESQRTNEFLYH